MPPAPARRVAELQIGAADNPRRRSARAINPTGAGSGEALDKLDLTNRAQIRRSVGAVHCPGLDKHCGAHIVAGTDIGDELVQQIALIGDALGTKIPEVMVRVADRQLRLQGRFLGQRQPVVSSIGHSGSS